MASGGFIWRPKNKSHHKKHLGWVFLILEPLKMNALRCIINVFSFVCHLNANIGECMISLMRYRCVTDKKTLPLMPQKDTLRYSNYFVLILVILFQKQPKASLSKIKTTLLVFLFLSIFSQLTCALSGKNLTCIEGNIFFPDAAFIMHLRKWSSRTILESSETWHQTLCGGEVTIYSSAGKLQNRIDEKVHSWIENYETMGDIIDDKQPLWPIIRWGQGFIHGWN